VVLLGIWIGVEAVRAFPNQMSYMNQLAIGKPHWWYLSDSNVEWGDDAPALAAYLRARGETRVRSAFLGDFMVLNKYGVQPLMLANPKGEQQEKTRYAAIGASFLAIAELIGLAKTAGSEARIWYLALAGSTIFVSWLVTQVMFAFHYAHEHYSPHGSHATEGGLDFPTDQHPDYWDFIYFSTSIGATSQTSDVAIKSKEIRRLVTLHAVVSFFFNTMVLALTINLLASLF